MSASAQSGIRLSIVRFDAVSGAHTRRRFAESSSRSASTARCRAAGEPKSTNDGLTDDKTFFVSFGQTWRTKTREPLLRQLIVTDGHAPDQYRADTVRNIAWYGAFDVQPNQKLYLAPPDRVRVW